MFQFILPHREHIQKRISTQIEVHVVFNCLQAGEDISVLTRNFKQLGQKYNDFNGYVEDTFTDYAAHYNATIGMLSLCPSLLLKPVNVIPQGQSMGL